MSEEKRKKREAEIEAAAYTILDRAGLDGLTMTALAREARASNETLYNWYGDRAGLFRTLVRCNSDQIKQCLTLMNDATRPAMTVLAELGPALLQMMIGPRAVALGRAAAGDASGTLGREIARGGRASIAPTLADVIARAQSDGGLAHAELHEITDTYLSLLLGDLQLRRVIGALPELSQDEIETRAAMALDNLARIYPGYGTAQLDAAE